MSRLRKGQSERPAPIRVPYTPIGRVKDSVRTERPNLPAAKHERASRSRGMPSPHREVYEHLSIDDAGRWLILTDVHLPWHDRETIRLAVRKAKRDGVVGVILNGDTLDYHELSTHDKDPGAARYVDEIETGRAFVLWLREQFPKARIVLREGNHEERLTRYVLRNAPALYGLDCLTTPELLKLSDIGADWVGDRRVILLGKLPVLHGHEYLGSGGTYPAAWLYLTTPDPQEQQYVPRLTLNVDDRDYFTKLIVTKPDDPKRNEPARKPSHERIKDAFSLARKRVKLITDAYKRDSDKAEQLRRWVKYITEDALVIALQLPSDLNAFKMFETLNDRGLKTSQVDIVKNYLFREAAKKMTEVQPKWSRLMGILESVDIDDVALAFMRHFIMTKSGMTRTAELFEKIEKTVQGPARAVDFVNEMEECAGDYAALLTADHKKWNTYHQGIRSSIRTMRELRVAQIRPLMLAVARKFATKETERAFRMFVSWSVRFLIAGGSRGGTVEEAYAEASRLVTKGDIKTVKELVAKLSTVTPSDEEFESAFKTARVSKNYLARYYLRALELKQKGAAEPEWVPNEGTEINLEHILPESPGTNWPHIKPEKAQVLHTRIGNMALLQAVKNSTIGNGSFADKKKVFEKSAYDLTLEVSRESSWGETEIEARQERLANLAVKTWPLEPK
jgi:hypothetical protein